MTTSFPMFSPAYFHKTSPVTIYGHLCPSVIHVNLGKTSQQGRLAFRAAFAEAVRFREPCGRSIIWYNFMGRMAAVAIHPFQTVSECTSNLRYLEKAQWIKICETISCNASGYKRRLHVIWPVLTMLSPLSFKKPPFQKQSPHPDWGWWINSILRFWCFDGAPSCGTSSVMSHVLQNYPKCYNPRMNWKQPPESTTMSKCWEAYRHGSVWGPKKMEKSLFRTKPGKHLKQKHNEIHIEIHPQICLVGAQIHPQIPKEWFGWVSQAGPDENRPINAFKAVSFLIVPFLESRSFCWTRWFKGKKLFSEILRVGGIYIICIYIYM